MLKQRNKNLHAKHHRILRIEYILFGSKQVNMAYFTEEYLNFFKELAANNNKDWFDLHRKRYEQHVREPFKIFVRDLIDALNEQGAGIELEPKHFIFRINRDIRFSKDKTPYKLHFSAALSKYGRKDWDHPSLYVQLDPEHARIYSGLYKPGKEALLAIREKIASEPKRFEQALEHTAFTSTFGEVHGEKNKIIPKHLKEDAKEQPLMYNKGWYYFAKYDPEIILKDDLIEFVVKHYLASQPLDSFFEDAVNKTA